MNRAERAKRYVWVTRPPRVELPKAVPVPRGRECSRCGWGPMRDRRRCPACLTRVAVVS